LGNLGAANVLGKHLEQFHLTSSHIGVGYEIPVSLKELANWVKTLQQQEYEPDQLLPGKYAQLPMTLQSEILRSPQSSIYLPPIGRIPPGQEEWFACMVAEISRLTGISSFCIHPEGSTCNQWDVFLTMLPEQISLSVENTSKDRVDFQTLDEIGRLQAEFPRIRLNFNTANWLGLRNSLNDGVLLSFFTKKRLHRIKLALPSNHRENEIVYKRDSYSPLHTSNQVLPKSFLDLCTAVPVVLTSTVPVGEFDVLLREVNYIEQLCAVSTFNPT